jgi:DNA-binding protein YbaB
MSDPLSNIERMVSDWERNAEENAARYQNMQQEVERISITESAADGAVSVTVGANGIPTNVEMTERVSRLRPDEIAGAVMQAMTKAQSRYPQELARIMGETVGETAATQHILATAQASFPSAEESPHPPETRGDGDDGDDSFGSVMR